MIVETIKARRTAPDGSVKYLKKFLGLSNELSDVDTSMLMHGSVYLEIDTSKCYLFDEGSGEWVEQESGQGGGDPKPYLSIDRLNRYLYYVVFDGIPDETTDSGSFAGGCSSYVSEGELKRNLDWEYDEGASFIVNLRGITGTAFVKGLTSNNLKDNLIKQLPTHLVDGVNDHGIMMSTHVLYNDWNATGNGSVSLTSLPLRVLQKVTSMDTIEEDLSDILDDLYLTPAMIARGYLIQVLVTDGTTSYVLTPKTDGSLVYEAVNITENPKLSNFKWVSSALVERSELQERPTGVERWNLMPCELSELRFTKCYEEPDRLSEFIGIRETTKDSSDEELEAIYDLAHEQYLTRERDGSLWQTMHSVVYDSKGMKHLWIQENWDKDYCVTQTGESITSEDVLDAMALTGFAECLYGTTNSEDVLLQDENGNLLVM